MIARYCINTEQEGSSRLRARCGGAESMTYRPMLQTTLDVCVTRWLRKDSLALGTPCRPPAAGQQASDDSHRLRRLSRAMHSAEASMWFQRARQNARSTLLMALIERQLMQ
jgi:hypothetical protein